MVTYHGYIYCYYQVVSYILIMLIRYFGKRREEGEHATVTV